MRPIQQNNNNNKRARGRGRGKPHMGGSSTSSSASSNLSSGNGIINLNRTLDSNGPDVKIRGTVAHIFEKYQNLARDANSQGEHVNAENYLQHAEHYYRLLAAANQAQAAQREREQGRLNGNRRLGTEQGQESGESAQNQGHLSNTQEQDEDADNTTEPSYDNETTGA